MKSLKKSVVAVVVIGVLSVAGMAFAGHGQGKGKASPMEPFGGHRPMMGQPWNGGNLPPAPQMPNGAPCCFGQNGPMGWQRCPFQPIPGQMFNGQGFGHRGGPRQGTFGQGFGHRGGPRQGAFGQDRGSAFGQEARGPRGARFQPRGRFSPDMPQDIRAKAVEAAKLRIDLEDVLSQKPLNREKALELKGQIVKLNQEIKAWRFEQKLDRIEESNKKSAEDAGKK